MYKFTDEDILKAVRKALERGVEVRMLMDKEENDNKDSLARKADSYGAKVKYWDEEDHETLHAKFMVYDQEICSIGSPNWTTGATKNNLEVWLTTTDCEGFKTQFEALWDVAKASSILM